MSQTNSGDMKAISEEHASSLSPDETLAVMKSHLKGKHDFITFNYNNGPTERIVGMDFKVIRLNDHDSTNNLDDQ